MYFKIITLLHIGGTIIWIGAGLLVLIQRNFDQKQFLTIIEKAQIPPAFFVPLTGCLLMIERTHLLNEPWMMFKITLSVLATGFCIASRIYTTSETRNDANPKWLALRFQGLMVFILILILIVVFVHE